MISVGYVNLKCLFFECLQKRNSFESFTLDMHGAIGICARNFKATRSKDSMWVGKPMSGSLQNVLGWTALSVTHLDISICRSGSKSF